jgi:hypothetical protein
MRLGSICTTRYTWTNPMLLLLLLLMLLLLMVVVMTIGQPVH